MRRKVLYISILAIVVMILGVVIYKKTEEKIAQDYVKEFLQLTYNCEPETIEDVLEKQSAYYEKTMRRLCEMNPPVSIEYIKETEQVMEVVSDIHTTVKKNTIGNYVVNAELMVRFKDIYEPDGFTEIINLNITMVKIGIFQYRISDIR